ncbi:sphingomyelin phosphodiesterase 5-like isoform X3 [Choloepus didactylus]|uniref:sphingomyelin phosphodiesterase 5-like isoform X3 n=1 Tax=Choloepus didactylus TaxID=27675 RepID=UPI0018A0E05D|nr:sphingomyelin phosphodiesterase 5-like isoform X3 [Choloepus didactylus]
MPRDQEAACAMQSPPDWPPAAGALRPSPFPHPVLHTLHDLARALLFPAYWAADQLLGYWAPAARTRSLGWLSSAAGAGAALLLLLACLPLALPGLLLWLPLQPWRRPFCYQPPPQCWTPPALWRPPADPTRCFGFLSANLCLLPHGLARFSNLPHSQRRAAAVGATLLAGLRPARYGATGCSLPPSEAPCGVLVAAVPAGLDFVCLQEVFDLRAARRLVHLLAPNLGPVLYDVGALGLQPGPHLKLLGSGLLLASRYPLLRAAFRAFPNARREDALASKGLLSAQAQLGLLDGRRVVGFLHCTHLHAPSEDGALRCEQMALALDWAEEFEAESRPGARGRGRGLQRAAGATSTSTTARHRTRASRSTGSSAASGTLAGWARAASSPGPWGRCSAPLRLHHSVARSRRCCGGEGGAWRQGPPGPGPEGAPRP